MNQYDDEGLLGEREVLNPIEYLLRKTKYNLKNYVTKQILLLHVHQMEGVGQSYLQ